MSVDDGLVPALAAAPDAQSVPSSPTAGAARRVTTLRASLGMLGGGQLGRMFVHAAQRQGHRVTVLDPDPLAPAAEAADHHLRAAYDDADALARLAATCEVVSTEFENVPAASLRLLAALGCRVAPAADAVAVCQHRLREKACFERMGVPCVPHAAVEAAAVEGAAALDAARFAPLLPGILKTSALGYDGKGQRDVASLDELVAAHAAFGHAPCVLEKRVPLAAELSVIVARGRAGDMVQLPVQRNRHHEGILVATEVPAEGLPPTVAQEAVAHARRLAEGLAYVGVLCVEFFVLEDGRLLANEMAPRPHNSGHYSIDACDISQFDLQCRTMLGLPLTAPRQHSAAVMLNLLGELWFDARGGAPREPDWQAVLALPGVHLHLYGKHEARTGRKMGHLTVTAADLAAAREVARRAAQCLGLPPMLAMQPPVSTQAAPARPS